MLEELRSIKSGKKELREFGLTIGGILVILCALVFWRGRRELWPYLLASGVLLIVLGLALPRALKPVQKAWMAVAVIIGFFVSRFILLVLFYLVLTPLGLIAKLFGKDLLDQKIDKNAKSYWRARRPGKREDCEKQY